MGKYKSDYERLEIVKKYKASRLTITEFAKQNGLAYSTLRDWVYAYDNIDGSFVKLQKEIGRPGVVLANEDCTVSILDNKEIYCKNSHFTRFDHSVVKIEFERMKITTSLEQAVKILERYYDKFGRH